MSQTPFEMRPTTGSHPWMAGIGRDQDVLALLLDEYLRRQDFHAVGRIDGLLRRQERDVLAHLEDQVRQRQVAVQEAKESVAEVLNTHFANLPPDTASSEALSIVPLAGDVVDRLDEYVNRKSGPIVDRKSVRIVLSHNLRLAGDEPWLVVISVPFGLFLASFMTEAGKDAYTNLKRLTSAIVSKARQEVRIILKVHDPNLGISLHLTHDLPSRAYRDLFTIDLPSLPGGYRLSHLEWRKDCGWILTINIEIRTRPGKATSVSGQLFWVATERRWDVLQSSADPSRSAVKQILLEWSSDAKRSNQTDN